VIFLHRAADLPACKVQPHHTLHLLHGHLEQGLPQNNHVPRILRVFLGNDPGVFDCSRRGGGQREWAHFRWPVVMEWVMTLLQTGLMTVQTIRKLAKARGAGRASTTVQLVALIAVDVLAPTGSLVLLLTWRDGAHKVAALESDHTPLSAASPLQAPFSAPSPPLPAPAPHPLSHAGKHQPTPDPTPMACRCLRIKPLRAGGCFP
jgi:hypothetical protein